ncbi:unnamed protein product [Chrysodeixis includens]|uniref:Uncharacterized protein n=1 Tax=Chrysodeixis includens TaxID=689277 RepID=A0A9N8KRF3_CHRIL|nr:unnamed protein product [Chrysodeixis includens]
MIGEIQAGSYSENLQETPPELKHEKGCYVDRIKEVIPFEGFSVLPRECMRIDCNVTQITYNTIVFKGAYKHTKKETSSSVSSLKRRRGRPKKRWRDDFKVHREDWFEVAQDRKTWKDLGEAFAQQWDTVV